MTTENINLDEIKKLKTVQIELNKLFNENCSNTKNTSNDDDHWEIGKNYFIRSVTHHYVGKLIKVTDKEFVLTDCSWIADDGRFSDAMNGTEFKEIEPYHTESKVIIGRGALSDATEYKYKLPTKQK